MTSIEQLSTPRPAGAPRSQATVVEQSRAIAEVQAAVVIAQNAPRDIDAARARMRMSCSQLALAERAFYSVPNRGDGESVHLARELAAAWGNLSHSIVELSRDDEAGQSEVMARAWCLETNVQSVRTFIVPHAKTVGKGAAKRRERITDLSDVVANNNNAGSRAVRETIFNVIPEWFRREAADLCRETLRRGNGEPLEVRVEKAVATFARIDVTAEQLEARLHRTRDRWDEQDVATLIVLWQSLNAGDTTKADEFPEQRVTAADTVREQLDAPAGVNATTGELDPTTEPGFGGQG